MEVVTRKTVIHFLKKKKPVNAANGHTLKSQTVESLIISRR